VNVLNATKRNNLRVLLEAGYSYREIERKTGVRRETISKYEKKFKAQHKLATEESKAASMPTGKSGQNEGRCLPGIPDNPPTVSACEEHREWIEDQVDLGRNAVSIYQDMVELFSFSRKYDSVRRFVCKLKKKEPERYDRLEFLPGEEAQVDYGQGALTINPNTGKYSRPRLFVMTLRYSRRSFRKVVWKSSQEGWCKSHEEAFRYFGGCPANVVLDNLKEGVITPDIYEPALNSLYSEMLLHYGVVADPARVNDPNRKGTVENAIQHTQNTALKGRKFSSIEEQNEWLMHWEEKWASTRVHGRTKQQVEKMFQHERPYLKALPLEGLRYFKEIIRTVSDDGTIQVDSSYYSALPAVLHTKVIVRIYDLEVEIYDPKTLELLRRHGRSYRKGSVNMAESDRLFNPSRETNYLLSQAGKIGDNSKRICDLWFKDEGRSGQKKMYGLVSLAKKYTREQIESAVELVLSKGIMSYKTIRKILEKSISKSEEITTINLFTQEHRLIRQPSEYGVFWNQHAKGGNE